MFRGLCVYSVHLEKKIKTKQKQIHKKHNLFFHPFYLYSFLCDIILKCNDRDIFIIEKGIIDIPTVTSLPLRLHYILMLHFLLSFKFCADFVLFFYNNKQIRLIFNTASVIYCCREK